LASSVGATLVLSFAVPSAHASTAAQSAYDETGGLYELVGAVLSKAAPVPPVRAQSVKHSRAGVPPRVTRPPRRSRSERPLVDATTSTIRSLGGEAAPVPFASRDAGVMALAAIVLGGVGATTLGAGVLLAKREPDCEDL
jgi:hypothetical protein